MRILLKLNRMDIDCIKSMYLEECVLYPLTVISDRYSGCYSGAKFTAWPLVYTRMPEAVDGGDIECSSFWEEADKSLIGMGSTVQEAVNDLLDKVYAFKGDEWNLKDFH